MNNINNQAGNSLQIHESSENTVLPKKGHNFFVIPIIIFLTVFLTGGIFYLAIQNKIQTPQSIFNSNSIAPKISPLPTKTETATSLSEPQKYLIIDGSLFKNLPYSQKELVVDKSQLKYEQLETIEIESFQLSPDKTKILLFTRGDISAYVLYYKNITTNEIKFVDFGEEALWSPNNRYIAFTRRPADVGPLYLYVFDTLLNENIDTIHTKDKIYTSYNQLVWSSTSDSITAQYETRDDIPYGNIIDKGETKIMLKL